jgi:acetyl-CoA synthetase
MRWVFDYKPDDIFWCTADVGWITGHSYVAYGPLALGGTQVIFEGIPTYPDAGRVWQLIERHHVSIFYTAPTAIRSLVKLGGICRGSLIFFLAVAGHGRGAHQP